MANNITAKTFPGVYTKIVDRSFLLPQTSRFRCGLIGVARKGPFDTPTSVTSLAQFQELFGQPLSGQYYLANAAAILSDLTDGMKVVRVGKKLTPNSGALFYSVTAQATGTVTGYNEALVLSQTVQGDTVYATIKQPGLPSTVNAQVASVGTNTSWPGPGLSAGIVQFTVTSGDPEPLQAAYSNALVSYSVGSPAANKAETILYAATYGTSSGDYLDAPLYGGPLALTCSGNKGEFSLQLSAATTPQYATLAAGDIIKIKEAYRKTTWEVRVKQVLPTGKVYLETSDRTDLGYQASPLQDNYVTATIHRKTGTVAHLFLEASSEGDWANGADPSTGLFVKVRPGGPAGTKKFEVYEGGALKETIDGLYDGSGTNSYISRLNGKSGYISVVEKYSGTGVDLIAANYSYGWAAGGALLNAGLGKSGGSFSGGYNGEAASALDFVGAFDTAAEKFTGIQSFVDTDNVEVDVLCCPGITDSVGGTADTSGVHRKLDEVAKQVNAVALIDVPAGLNARAAIDWHNGAGLYSGRGRIDSPNIACYWNWFTITDPFTQQDKVVPPTLGALRCLAFTFDRDKPWYAAAGDVRGLITEAQTVEFERVSEDTKQAMYGNGQSINGIFLDHGQIKLWGERTLQVAESKLSVVHNIILVNYVVSNMATIGRRFLFEPNDPELLIRMQLAFTQFLDKVKNERGLESYSLVMDDSNNSADTRNRREVIVDLAIVPVDAVERIFITATVFSSGAVLNALSSE